MHRQIDGGFAGALQVEDDRVLAGSICAQTIIQALIGRQREDLEHLSLDRACIDQLAKPGRPGLG
jgi:hypothetical protein